MPPWYLGRRRHRIDLLILYGFLSVVDELMSSPNGFCFYNACLISFARNSASALSFHSSQKTFLNIILHLRGTYGTRLFLNMSNSTD